MRRAYFFGALILVVMALPLPVAAGVELKISDSTDVDLGFSLQTLGRITDFRNPNSNDADGGLDFFLRRGLFHLDGNFTDYVKVFLQAETSGGTDNNPSARISDATANLHYRDIAQLIMGLQKPPAYRSILTSDDALLAIDRPGITGYNLTWGLRGRVEFDTTTLKNTNSGIHGPYQDRDLGATFFGTYSFTDMLHLKYYAGIYRGIQKGSDGSDKPRFTARLQMNLFDPEPDYDNRGTYLGTKKTIAIGYSNDTQHDVVTNLKQGSGVDYTSYNEFDLFVDYPAGPGSVTFEGSYIHT
ncbi:MAG: porin [Deltaproteobacteria bacterium]|jgi:hypothetical protein